MTLNMFTDKVRKFFGLAPKYEASPYSVLNTSTGISAKSAYMRSKYGVDKSQTELLKSFFNDVNSLIASKTLDGSYCCMVEIDKDIKEFIPEIITRFRDKLGYNLIVLDENTVITNTSTKEEIKFSANSTFVVLMWSNPDISAFKTDLVEVDPAEA